MTAMFHKGERNPRVLLRVYVLWAGCPVIAMFHKGEHNSSFLL